ncbi:ClpXP protease specificity-enhancing factor [Pseudoalteromonas tunicata]|jgi:stringent starvation protein B|uniref:Stringent starvation protein B n=1 Tax=Pseudoalteromonas tunicata D2 TaxID=87626 RepID=A4C8A3_9GAMM|nr:ClpXP protease specificity-enhancing factor [Pseudoalteromonas tunicata]ATC93323.1 stringent starvation protein B [Pseudoalteromonas tunicata]AXT32374.1 ClpXP protease specificity-enhancing factor [Pseudoalteromonas tunicata]EAR28818.1 stringent starvation protein B [Pseudoalteromonas tunicata D2]MDP4983057.1 ClpXP protease specificity-enhancing factor [Pseudoalteromonas tunicata]MDP5213502.1 ClpXP protease specificity-enhancing factor [Pseudoalteromonas tunicata]
MTPNRPYLLRAFFDWIVDNQCTPHLVVDATYPNTTIPTQFVQDGQIVLNISPSAVAQFAMDNQEISFNARFGGQPMRVVVPVGAVLAIYARENGEGTVFTQDLIDEDDYFDDEDENQDHIEVQVAESEVKPADKKKGSHLRVIK